jgi:hypothetical protein
MNNRKLENALGERLGEPVLGSILLLPGSAQSAAAIALPKSFELLGLTSSHVVIYALKAASWWGGHALDRELVRIPRVEVSSFEVSKGWPCGVDLLLTDGRSWVLSAPRFQWRKAQAFRAALAQRPSLSPDTKSELKLMMEAAAAKRADYFREERLKGIARKLATARAVLAKVPASTAPRPFRTVFEAPPEVRTAVASRPVQELEGIVTDTYGCISGHLDGADDFSAFDMIGPGEKITSWRDDYTEIKIGCAVRMKFVNGPADPEEMDYIGATVLEVSVAD